MSLLQQRVNCYRYFNLNEREVRFCKRHGETEYRNVSKNSKHLRCCKCSSEAVQRRRDKLKELCVEYKGGCCQSCGYSKCLSALEFHHLDPNEKDFGIGSKGYTRSFDKVKIELDKCVMLCANCHREEHANLRVSAS